MIKEDPYKSNDFYFRVYEIVSRIPLGRVTSYKAIAIALGVERSSRLVGIAMNHSHELAKEIPAHRVVNRVGLLTGRHHFLGEKSMDELLISEGIVIEDNKVMNFNKVFWNPVDEL